MKIESQKGGGLFWKYCHTLLPRGTIFGILLLKDLTPYFEPPFQ